jgi:8-oxo-dGTP pyrophosphatase MutT (NUDIX family)
MSLLRQFRRHAYPDFAGYRRFVVAGRHVGWVKPALADRLMAKKDVFVGDAHALCLHPNLSSAAARSAAMAEMLAALRAENLVPGWRDELYPVGTDFNEAPLLTLERAAAPLFGILAYGLNVNGFVGRGWGMKVWIARRAATKAVDPNMQDLMVGGGQPFGLSLADNLVKECWEEAGIAAPLAEQATPVGIVTLVFESSHGLRIDQQFNFDLELPESFTPQNQDGEVAGFELVPVSELLHRLRSTDDFMFDSAIVNIDFLIRHGFIGPEDPDYLALVAGLRPALPYDMLQVAA